MKNAIVLVDHHGDEGTVTEGMILKDVATKRFETLEKRGLVREATAKEVEEGYKPPFTPAGVGGDGEEAEEQEAEGDTKKAEEPENKKAAEPANKAKK